jgi:hypothetical protein
MSRGEIKMMKRLSLITVGFMLILSVSGAQAAYLVDTGEGDATSHPSLTTDQWLAGEFVLDNSSTITDIEGWMFGNNGIVTIAIRNDGGEIPGSEIYSQSFDPGLKGPPFTNNWHGISDLNWLLDPGTYWVSFEVRDGSTYNGKMGDNVPNPLLNNAYTQAGEGTWVPYDPTAVGIRIQGDVGAVPIPSAIWFLGSGLIGLVGIRRKHRKH